MKLTRCGVPDQPGPRIASLSSYVLTKPVSESSGVTSFHLTKKFISKSFEGESLTDAWRTRQEAVSGPVGPLVVGRLYGTSSETDCALKGSVLCVQSALYQQDLVCLVLHGAD